MIMSRSKRKTPVVPMTSHKSDKPYKKAEHQRERAQIKVKLRTTEDDAVLPSPKEFGGLGRSLKEDKLYVGNLRSVTKR